MRLSIVIAAYNEGDKLRRTVESCYDSGLGPGAEIVVADDQSDDGSVERVEGRYESLRVVRAPERAGVSPTKDRGARAARGGTLVFLDGHSKPEPGSLERLAEGVAASGGQAVVTPGVAALDADAWSNRPEVGHGGLVDLDVLMFRWADLASMAPVEPPGRRAYYLSPSLTGCALAVTRAAYERIGGFDADMRGWGVEDIDFGLKAWLMGHPIWHDPGAVVGHRFRREFDYEVRARDVVGNTLRMARRAFPEPLWRAWIERYRRRLAPADFEGGWLEFEARRESADRDRDYLERRGDRDLDWYMETFHLPSPLEARARP